MRFPLAALALAVAAAPAPARAAIRAVFVGIDKYAYSQARLPRSDFKDLNGAVNDARHIKAALRAAYGLDLDREKAGKCSSANRVSITLTDRCATRAKIFEAWKRQIAASARGDTLILYYAGHGSQFIDNDRFDQASGYNDTILPHDARRPDATVEADILDREIRAVIDTATAKGVNVVTIFDSCHSGTATRDGPAEGQSRAAPPRAARALAPMVPAAPPSEGAGYRVHFAAAADGEEAREVGRIGERSGVFTSALAETIRTMPNAAFADIATEVRLRVAERGHFAQRPQAEGALTASMGGAERHIALLDAAPGEGGAWLAGGRLVGVTVGSAYALFASNSAAMDETATPLAGGIVTKVEDGRALVALPGPPATLPARLVARETAHAFGEERLKVRNGAAPADRAAIAAMLSEMDFVEIGEPSTLAIVPGRDDYKLAGKDGIAIASLGPATAADFPARLRTALEKVARVQVLLALRTDTSRADANFCIGNDLEADAYGCAPATRSDGPMLQVGRKAKLIAVNRADTPRYIYVFAIDENYGVSLAMPDEGEDPAVRRGRPVVAYGNPDAKGRLTFLTLATDQPIKASVLEQSGAGTRDPAACDSELARALCAAQRGTRDPSVPRVGGWTATVTSAIVE
jgi:hypothetical protein